MPFTNLRRQPPPPVACTDPVAAIFCAVLTRSVQPVGVTCFHVVYLLVLGRLLHFVARSSSAKLALLRRFARAVVPLTVVGDMVRLRSCSHCICSGHKIQWLCAESLARPFFFQVGIAGNFTCAGYLLSSLRQTAAAATAFDSGTGCSCSKIAVILRQTMTDISAPQVIAPLAVKSQGTWPLSGTPPTLQQASNPFARLLSACSLSRLLLQLEVCSLFCVCCCIDSLMHAKMIVTHACRFSVLFPTASSYPTHVELDEQSQGQEGQGSCK